MSRPCASCGATVPDGEEFCDNCGMPVAPDASEPRSVRDPGLPASDAPTAERTVQAAGAGPKPPPPPTGVGEMPLQDPRADTVPNAAIPASSVLPTPAPPTRAGPATPARRGGWFVGLASLGLVLVLLLGTGGWLLLSGRDNAPGALQDQSPEGPRDGQGSDGETPPGGETTRAPEPTPAADPDPEPGPEPEAEPDYDGVQENGLAMEVPASWEVQTGQASEGSGTSWTLVLGTAEVSVTAAPDLAKWYDSGDGAGMYAVASRALTGYTNEQITTTGPNDLSGMCTIGDAQDFDEDTYSSRVQPWTDCGEDPDSKSYTVAIAPKDGACAVALRIGTVGEDSMEAAQHIMDTLAVDCAALPEAAAPESVTPSEVPTGEDAPEQPPGGYVPPEPTTAGPTPHPEGTTLQ